MNFFIKIMAFLLFINSCQLFPFVEEKNGIKLEVIDYSTQEYLDKELVTDPTWITSRWFALHNLFPIKIVIKNNSNSSKVLSPDSVSLNVPELKKLPTAVTLKWALPVFLSVYGSMAGVCFTGAISLIFIERMIKNRKWEDKGYHPLHGKWVRDEGAQNLSKSNQDVETVEKGELKFLGGSFLIGSISAFCLYKVWNHCKSLFINMYKEKALCEEVTILPGETAERILFVDRQEYNKDEFLIKLFNKDESQETIFTVDWRL